MLEAVFEQSFSEVRRLATVRAASIVSICSLPQDSRPDLEQEALLELWRKRTAYDPARGSWCTFAEPVVANRLASLVRSMCSYKAGTLREKPIENAVGLSAPPDRHDLRVDVCRVLNRVSQFDRSVARCLIDHTAIETSQLLGVSKARTYRALGRLRTAFTDAGLGPRRRCAK
jgi:RNA polymerase sigma-70 factor (ECF subfamily)